MFPVLPRRPSARPQARKELVLNFHASADVIIEAVSAEPALTRGGQQAHFGTPAHQPARPHVAPHERLVELCALVFPVVDVETRAQAPAVSQRILVFTAAPPHHADVGTGAALRAPAERQAVDIDELRVRGGVDIGIRGNGEPEIPAPAAPGADHLEKPLDIGNHGRRRLAGQDPLEMVARQIVLAFEKERPRQLQTHPHQARTVDQNGVQGRDGLGQEKGPLFVINVRPGGRSDARQADEKPHVGLVGMIGSQWAQHGQGLVEAAPLHQGPRVLHPGVR